MVKFISDNGGEYISCVFKEYLAEAGIKHETSTPYCPEQKQNETTRLSQKVSRVCCILEDLISISG
jgi:hypothetical protein